MENATPQLVSEKIRSSKKILLITHSRPTVDSIISISVMYSVLKDFYKKDVEIAISGDLGKRYTNILSRVQVTPAMLLKTLPQKFYTISIKKQGEKIESINFNEENETFNFVITPFKGALDLSTVHISESGADYDCIITVDTAGLNFLGDFYKTNKSVFDATPIISFDSHKSNSKYAALHFTVDADTTSQVILHYMHEVNIPISEENATLLFAGVYGSLNMMMHGKVRPNTFADLGRLSVLKASHMDADTLLYAPYNLNEIFLVGDILDSSNEGISSKVKSTRTSEVDTKVVGGKITLNKEELDVVDMDKTAQVVFWNIKMHGYAFAYVIFQKSIDESIAYIMQYDTSINLSEYITSLGGRQDRMYSKVTIASDMNGAEQKLRDVFGIVAIQKDSKFPNPSFNEFDDDFDIDEPAIYNDPFAQSVASLSDPVYSAPVASMAAPILESPATQESPAKQESPLPTGITAGVSEVQSTPVNPPKFDPRAGH